MTFIIKKIGLSMGHGPNTAGKRTPIFPAGTKSPKTGKNFMHEHEFNYATGMYLKSLLEAQGFKVIVLSSGTVDTPLADRVKKANKEKVDLYLSIHANANTSVWGDWGGIETFVWPKGDSKSIGSVIHKHLVGESGLRDRGVKDGSHLYEINSPNAPSVLVECGFMDNLKEAKMLLSDSYRKACAQRLCNGVCEAAGKKVMTKPTEKPTTGKDEVKMTTEQQKNVNLLKEKGIVSQGFTPKSTEQVETMMAIANVIDYIDGKLVGQDAPVSPALKPEIEKAKKAGITDGSRPGDYATRQEVMAMLVRAIK